VMRPAIVPSSPLFIDKRPYACPTRGHPCNHCRPVGQTPESRKRLEVSSNTPTPPLLPSSPQSYSVLAEGMLMIVDNGIKALHLNRDYSHLDTLGIVQRMQSYRTLDAASRLARRRIARGWRKRDRSGTFSGSRPLRRVTHHQLHNQRAVSRLLLQSDWPQLVLGKFVNRHAPSLRPLHPKLRMRSSVRIHPPVLDNTLVTLYFVLKQRSRLRATARSAKHLRRERVSYGSLCHRSGLPLTLSKFPGLPASEDTGDLGNLHGNGGE